jgi:hypothetical protein
MQKNYLNKKDLAERQKKFIAALEGIGDVLVFETKRRKNKNVIPGLKRIESMIKTFFDIQKRDPDKFEQLILAQEYFEVFRKDEEEAKILLEFLPEKYLITFSTAINQILRIHEAAVDAKNEEISRFAIYHLEWLLAEISQTPKNDLFVEQLLKYLAGVMELAIENQDRSMYAASIRWYIKIVFNRLGQKGGFDISYLDLFDKYFFSSAKYIISRSQTSLFENLVSFLVDGIQIPSYNKGKIWDYGLQIREFDAKKYSRLDKEYEINGWVKALANSEKDLDTKEKREKWLEKFEGLKTMLAPHLNKEQKENARKIEAEIREFVDAQFKYNNLLEILFAIGAYCLFKQRPEYIKYLWEYKQPSDSVISWMGPDIVPNTPDGVVSLYFKKGLFERKFDFWEGHHGSEVYYKKYFLLLLARTLQPLKANTEGKYEQIEAYDLPDLHIHQLSDLERSGDDLANLATDLETEKDTLYRLGFNIEASNELFYAKIIPFLQELKRKAIERIKNLQREKKISQKKIEEFKDEVLKEFKRLTRLRNIFVYYELYKDKTGGIYEGVLDRFEINKVSDKAAFFDEWHVHYLDWGSNYGRELALGENSQLFEKIAKQCKEINEGDFEKSLGQFEDLADIIIITTNVAFIFLENSENFKPKWHRDTPQVDVDSFEGCYSFMGIDIPIFETYHVGSGKKILMLAKSKLGTLTQYSPLNEGENEELRKDMFYINIQAYSEKPELVKQIIQKPPEWLKKVGDEETQKDYLREKVLIHIFERFEYTTNEEFEGYKLELKD